jgi:hypothetical protein
MRSAITLAFVLALAACGGRPEAAPVETFAAVGTSAVELSFPEGWQANGERHPFDLQWLAVDGSLTTGAFHWSRSDLAADLDGERLLQLQVEDMRGKRKDFKELAPRSTQERDGRRLTTLVYTGEKEQGRHVYRFTLVEFLDHPDDIVVVLQTSRPSQWARDEAALAAITGSVRRRHTPSGPR